MTERTPLARIFASLIGSKPCISDRGLDGRHGAAHRIDHAAELDEAAVAGALDDTAVMHGDGRIDEISAQRRNQQKRVILVPAGEAAVPTTSAARIAAIFRASVIVAHKHR